MLIEQNIEEVRKYFPKMSDDIEVRILRGKIQVCIYGIEEWKIFEKNGKINTFTGDLKKYLGPTIKKLESNYFIRLKRSFPYMNEKDFEIIYEKEQFRIKLLGEKGLGVKLFTKNGELRLNINEKIRNKLGPTADELIAEEKIENMKDQEKINKYKESIEKMNVTSDEYAEASEMMNATFERMKLREENIEKIEENVALNEEETT